MDPPPSLSLTFEAESHYEAQTGLALTITHASLELTAILLHHSLQC